MAGAVGGAKVGLPMAKITHAQVGDRATSRFELLRVLVFPRSIWQAAQSSTHYTQKAVLDNYDYVLRLHCA